MGGGVPLRFVLPPATPGAAPARDGQAYAYPRRDLLADEVECLVRAAGADGVVLLGGRNAQVSGLLLGAARLNLPSIVVPAREFRGGPSSAGDEEDALVRDLLKDRAAAGRGWPVVPASSQDDYASHAFACQTEVMGLSFPGSVAAPAGSPEQMQLAATAGRRAVELVRQNFTIRRVLLANAFLNAIRLDAAFGGFSETAVFLLALAHEAGVRLSLDAFGDLGARTPWVCRLDGTPGHTLTDLHAAGGVPAVLAALKGLWLPLSTVSGRGINELAKTARVKDPHILKVRSPLRTQSGLTVLRGNLAPQGALFRRPPDFTLKGELFSGVVRVCDTRDEALKAVLQKAVKPGDVLVVRYEGARGGPGLRPLAFLGRVIAAQGLAKSVAVVTDGIWGPDPAPVLAVEMVSPEAMEASTLSILKDGDRLDIDLAGRRLNVHLTDTDMKVRLARWQAPAPRARGGFLARYARSVSPALEGAVLR